MRLIHGMKNMQDLAGRRVEFVDAEVGMWGKPDFSRYTFLFHYAADGRSYDGMEHLDSTQIIYGGRLDDGNAVDFTLWMRMTSRVRVCSRSFPTPSLRSIRRILEPCGPRIFFTASTSGMSFVNSSSILMIWSPDLIPARYAGGFGVLHHRADHRRLFAEVRFIRPPADAPEMRYLHARRERLGGYLPARKSAAPKLAVPPLATFVRALEGSGTREQSTTQIGRAHV